MRLQIPPKVTRIIDTLQSHGYEAYAVGGCIRDTILARRPDDWDITTSARPQEVKGLFERTVDTGLQHGTVTVLLAGEGFEVTTYRVDGEYEDHRHPAQVEYASLLSEDLMRRDFTINAMAYNKEQGLVDMFGGMQDLQRKVIRCVGNPRERFTEDALRILRALRFSAQLGFAIETETMDALTELAPTLVHVSKERIQVELVKLLCSSNPHYIQRVYQAGILQVILPELKEPEEETLEDLQKVENQKALRLAVLLYPLGEQQAAKTLRNLRFDNDTISKVKELIRWRDYKIYSAQREVRMALHKIGNHIFPLLLDFQETRRPVDEQRKLYKQILEEKQCFSLNTLALSGSDLIELGIPKGPQIGRVLKQCLYLVLEEPDKNRHEYLLDYVKKQLNTPKP